MSQTLTAFTFAYADRVDIRRYCGYPVFGTGAVMFATPWYFRYYLAMESRLNAMVVEEANVLLARIAELRTLEAAIPAVGGSLDTAKAAVWTRNPAELKERMRLYYVWRVQLCEFLGIPPGPGVGSGGGTLRVVV